MELRAKYRPHKAAKQDVMENSTRADNLHTRRHDYGIHYRQQIHTISNNFDKLNFSKLLQYKLFMTNG